MDYMVVGPDGQEYGPANVDMLKQWATENRLGPQTMLKHFQTGQTVAASSVPGIFPPPAAAPPQVAAQPMSAGPAGAPPGQNWAQPPNYYQRGPGQPQGKPYYGQDTGSGDIWMSILWSVLAIIFFFVFQGLGLIWAIYGVIRAFRAHGKGHRGGVVAIVISIVALVAVIIGWAIRLSTGNYGMYGSSPRY